MTVLAHNTDTTFITNEGEKNLKERFRVLIKDTRLFDVLVGYFYTSGFHALYKSLENAEKIRILIGISTSKQTSDLIQKAQTLEQGAFEFSHAETKSEYADKVASEMEYSDDKAGVEEGVSKFIEWLQKGKLEVKAYPSSNIHAKLYIMTFVEGDVAADFESIGKLDHLIEQGADKYKNIFIDEAHRFRAEMNITYEMLAQICRGKRVILVTATPLNNFPRDILSQIKLFQKSKKSTIPNLPNLEGFFNNLDKKLKGLDRQKDYDEYIETVKGNAREIREKVLKYLIVRRTRAEIIKYFAQDLKQQKLKFPEVADPETVLYQLNNKEDLVFSKTIELVTTKFSYSRYTPMLYYEGKITQPEELAQKNMRKFMKILLVKRLESSF